jgi:glycosyl transferase family 25
MKNDLKKIIMKNYTMKNDKNIDINNIIPTKYVINLKRRPERLIKFFHNCPFNDVKVIYGFDGKNINNETNNEKSNLIKFKKLRVGEIGCFITHLRLYKKMIDNNIESILIMEDDAIFCDSFINKFTLIENELESNQNIIFIGGRFTPNYVMLKENYTNIDNKIYIIKHNKNAIPIHDIHRTTHAYIIYKHTALILLNEFNKASIIQKPIDNWLFTILADNNVDVHSTLPLLCHSPLIGDSDIR